VRRGGGEHDLLSTVVMAHLDGSGCRCGRTLRRVGIGTCAAII